MDYQDWAEELKREEQAHRDWREKSRRVEKRYKLDAEEQSSFNILWSNVEILQAALYSQTPKPDVQRRFKDKNPLAKAVAMVLERAVEFSIDDYDFDAVVNPAINNYLVSGIGQVRVNYVPYFQEREQRVELEIQTDEEGNETYFRDGEPVKGERDETGAFVMDKAEEIVYQAVDCSTVPWSRFRYSPAKDWDTVWWQGEDHYLTEDQVRRTFVVQKDDHIPLAYKHQGQSKDEKEGGQLAKVTEIWDKRSRTHFGICEGVERILKFRAGDGEADDDPLGLSSFWPYPKPLAANVVAGSVTPIPDYLFYQEQALEMDRLTKRINGLSEQLKWRGAYDASFSQLANIKNASDGDFVPIENFAARFGEGKGIDAVMATMPIVEIRAVVMSLMEARDQVKQSIYEITGISDIVRGATKASETLGAQQLKGQFANMRLSKRQNTVQQFIREIFRIKAEIIAEHFEPDILTMMTGIPVTPEMMEVMKSDVLRAYSVDVETDSTILADQAEEQQQRTEVVRAVTELVQMWGPVIMQAPQLAPLAKQLILFELGAFKAGRVLEEAVEEAFDAIGNVAASPAAGMVGPGATGPNPPPGNNLSVVPGAGTAGGGGVL